MDKRLPIIGLVLVLAALNGVSVQAHVGPVNGSVNGSASFSNTSVLVNSHVSPASLSGKVRVEKPYQSNLSVKRTMNTNNTTRFNLNFTGDAKNVTLYMNTKAIAASQHLNNSTVYIDGKSIPFGTSNASGKAWVVIVVPHFSNHTMTVSNAPLGGGTGTSTNTWLLAGFGVVVVLVIAAGLYLYTRKPKQPSF